MQIEETKEQRVTPPTVGLTKDELLYMMQTLTNSTIKGVDLPIAWSVYSKLVQLYQSV